MMMLESSLDTIQHIHNTTKSYGVFDAPYINNQYIMEQKSPEIVGQTDEDSVLYVRRNVSESSPSNDSVSDENRTNFTQTGSESGSNNLNDNHSDNGIPLEITGDIATNNENTPRTGDINSVNSGSNNIPHVSVNDKQSVYSENYILLLKQNSQTCDSPNDIEVCKSNHKCIDTDSVKDATNNAEWAYEIDTVENIDNESWTVHEENTNRFEIHMDDNVELPERNFTEIEVPHTLCEANNVEERASNSWTDQVASVSETGDKKQTKKGRLLRNVLKPIKKTYRSESVEERLKLKQLVSKVRIKNGESKSAKRKELKDDVKNVFRTSMNTEDKKSQDFIHENTEKDNTHINSDKPPPLLVKINIKEDIGIAENAGTSVIGIGKRLPKKRTLKEFETDENSKTVKRKKKESKREERRREQAKLLKEARKTKKEERLRWERMKERQKELDERYLVIDEDIKPPVDQDGEKDAEIPSETNAAPHIPVVKRYVLDENSDTKEILIEIDPVLLAKLKPHQVEAVRFMYDCCIESIDQLHSSSGGGCILAHCMGLGKTLSVISFVYTLMSNIQLTGVKKCLIVCPLNTVKNWVNEFHKWTTDLPFKVKVYELSNVKESKKRVDLLNEWNNTGGVMILGYEMYRNLVQAGKGKVRVQKETYTDILANPGPDLVICDEGHILKNSKSLSYKAMNMIRTRRRVILTGTPLQNNLKEYYHMVNYVKPLLLSTMKNFRQRFINPIMEGQCKDSSDEQIKRMKNRVHVLHKIVGGCVQRKDYSALTKFLPPKHEYVISVRMGTKQCSLYETYLSLTGVDGIRKVMGRNARLFKDYQSLMKIWTHPWLLTQDSGKKESKKKSTADKDLYQMVKASSSESLVTERDAIPIIGQDQTVTLLPKDEIDADTDPSSQENDASYDSPDIKSLEGRRETNSQSPTSGERSIVEESIDIQKDVNSQPTTEANFVIDEESNSLVHTPESNQPDNFDIEDLLGDWWRDYVNEADGIDASLSGKIVLLMEILDMSRRCGDKLLVFSQSIPSLNLIESFLRRRNELTKHEEKKSQCMNTWVRDKDYFRIDGSTNAQKRKEVQKSFNDPQNHRACLFLISTKAGSLGTNLVAANRVIIFDASWNPSHDIQSIFRVYRFGQIKPVYVYRFLAQGTMEEKIYERQVTKQSLSQRVIDEHQIERHFTMADLQALYKFTPDRLDEPDREDRPLPMLPKDDLLANLMTTQKDWIVTFHEHDSLLENIEEQELTEEEKRIAWEEYERKALKIFRPSVAELNFDDDQSHDSVQLVSSPVPNDRIQTNYDPLPSIAQSSLDDWLSQPEQIEFLDTLKDLIEEKCSDVLMEGDEHDYTGGDRNGINRASNGTFDHANQYIESAIPPGDNRSNLNNYVMDLSINNRGVLNEMSYFDPESVAHGAISVDSDLQNYGDKTNFSKVVSNRPKNEQTDQTNNVLDSTNIPAALQYPEFLFQNNDSTDKSSTRQTVPLNLSSPKPSEPVINTLSVSSNYVHRNLNTPDPIIADSNEKDIFKASSENSAVQSNILYKKPKQRMLERLLFDNQTSTSSPLTLQDFLEIETSLSTSMSPSSLSPTRSSLSSTSPIQISSTSVPLNLSTNDSPEDRLVIDLQTPQQKDAPDHEFVANDSKADRDSKSNVFTPINTEIRSSNSLETNPKMSLNEMSNTEIELSIDMETSPTSGELPKLKTIPLTVIQDDDGDINQQSVSNRIRPATSVFYPIKMGEYDDISDLSDNDGLE